MVPFSSKTTARVRLVRSRGTRRPPFPRENVTQKRERADGEREGEKRKEKSYIFRKRDAFGAIRIARVPLLFVDAVGTLVPTNAEDRNANAMLFDACVCVCLSLYVVVRILLFSRQW